MKSLDASVRVPPEERSLTQPVAQPAGESAPWPPVPGARASLSRCDDIRRAALDLTCAAQRSLALFSAALEPAVFDRPALLEAVAVLARRRRARLRILVRDPRYVMARGHGLVELARRLSTTIELRRPHPRHRDGTEQLLVTDEAGLLFRPTELRCEGWAFLYAPVEARRRLRFFDAMWSLAEPDPELQRLYL